MHTNLADLCGDGRRSEPNGGAEKRHAEAENDESQQYQPQRRAHKHRDD